MSCLLCLLIRYLFGILINMHTNDETLLANRQAFADVENLEAKIRKKDLLIDDEWLFEFYDQRLPEYLVSVKGLLAWL